MKKYLIVVEATETGFSSYSPDLPGCIATGSTRAEAGEICEKGSAFHLESMRTHEAADESARRFNC
jgi:predicted RNase H-like HicB family nuclease